MEAALAQLRHLAETADAQSRKALKSAMLKLIDAMEGPDDLVLRVGYMHLYLSTIVVGIDLGLFKFLVDAGNTLSVQQISQKTGADEILMNRLLRYLASHGAIDEVSAGQFQANHVTKNLATKIAEAGLRHNFYTVCPEYQALPSFLKRTGYKNPEDEMHTPFQDAFHTDLHPFAWLPSHQDNMQYFNDYMALRRGPETSWLSVYPVSEETKDWTDAQRPLYVNVGGGIGHQCAEFKEKYPHIPGRVILEDLPHCIASAMQTPGVENIEHNFFEPQPIKGAKFYFMRGVLHDHPSHKVQVLLSNIKSAMAPDSILLLDEFIMPESGVNADAAAMDLTMMAACASMERTEAQWREELAKAGLKLCRTFPYMPGTYESVMEVRLQ